MNESLPDVTVHLFQFIEGLDPTGIALSCTLDCTRKFRRDSLRWTRPASRAS